MTNRGIKQKLYNSEIVAGSLLIPEIRKVAEFLFKKASEEDWYKVIVIDNILQKRSLSSAKRQAMLIRKRLGLSI